MEPLPAQLLPATAHVVFGIFNLAIFNVLAWVALIVVFFVMAWMRLPRIFEPGRIKNRIRNESDSTNTTIPQREPEC